MPVHNIIAISIMLSGIAVASASAQCVDGQPGSSPSSPIDWEAAAGGKMSFDVASVKTSKPNVGATSAFPLGSGDAYAFTGGRFCVTNLAPIYYVMFAYKLTEPQRQNLASAVPRWVTTEQFDIEAKGPSNATKDQMRLMLQSLLADRFKLVIHRETVQKPAFSLVFAKNGTLGPQLQPHSDKTPCTTTASEGPDAAAPKPLPPSASSGLQLPAIRCGGFITLTSSGPGRTRFGARNITMALFAALLPNPVSGLDRPVLDHTGLSGSFDFSLEFSPDPNPARPDFTPDDTGPTFMQALEEQLGLKFESTTAAVDVIVVDRIERPSEN
jgi:uncharacterized protein (TIGR03435 family)